MKTDTNIEKILNKLRKLKNLYEGAKAINSEEEANVAAIKIQNLLTQYNLSMDEVPTEEKSKMMDEFLSVQGKWDATLTYVLCKFNFCKCFIYGGIRDKKVVIIGESHNVETVKWMKTMFTHKLMSLAKVRYRAYKKTMDYTLKPIGESAYRKQYLTGCVWGLEAKFKEERERQKAENANTTALVIKKDGELTAYQMERFGKAVKKKTTTRSSNITDYGYKDGRRLNVNKQVNPSTTTKRIG